MFATVVHWKDKSQIPAITGDWNFLDSAIESGENLLKVNKDTVDEVEIIDLDTVRRAALVFNSGRTFIKQEYQYAQ